MHWQINSMMGLLIVFLAIREAPAEYKSIVLIEGELSALRGLLSTDSKRKLFTNLSEAGRSVLGDVSNVAITLDNEGKWFYRHGGNKRKLIEEPLGKAEDFTIMEKAMNSPDYLQLTVLGPRTLDISTIAMLARSSYGRSHLAIFLHNTLENQAISPATRELVITRVGEAVIQLPKNDRAALIAATDNSSQWLTWAFRKSDKLEQSRLKGIWNGRFADAVPGLTEKSVAQCVLDLQPADYLTGGWKLAGEFDDKRVYTGYVGCGLKTYLEISPDAGIVNLSKVFGKTDWRKGLASGKFMVYVAPQTGSKVKPIDFVEHKAAVKQPPRPPKPK